MRKKVVNECQEYKGNVRAAILLRFGSIKSFCIFHNIEYLTFRYILNQYPKASMSELLQYYRTRPYEVSQASYIFYGVSLQGICLRYQLDYDYFSRELSTGSSFDEALISAILNTPFFIRSFIPRLKALTPLIQNLSLKDLQKTLEVLQCDSDLIDNMVLYYCQYHKVKDALNAYYIVDFIENGWEDFYSQEIKKIYQNYDQVEAYHQYMVLKRNTRGEILSRFGLTEKDIQEYYNAFYSDFLRVKNKDGAVWTYNRKKILIPNGKQHVNNLPKVSK